jgi:hypothetical protein
LADQIGAGGSIPIYIAAQNAGVLVTKARDHFIVEVFEVSPLNEAVISTKGRLRRSFPASGVSIKRDVFQSPDFREVFASTLAKMSHQEIGVAQSTISKTERLTDEDRDTIHPKMVTDFLLSFLLAFGKTAATKAVWKNTRDEVNWHDHLLPWRRSPVWLVTRVVLQLIFSRAPGAQTEDAYKHFMVYHMSEILEQINDLPTALDSDILFTMSAKIHKRLRKLNNVNNSLREFIHGSLRRTNDILHATWARVQELESTSLPLSKLQSLDFEQDTLFSMPELSAFIDSLGKRGRTDTNIDFQPQYALTRHFPDEIPDSYAFRGKHRMFDLIAFETWVATSLDSWVEVQKSEAGTCGKLRLLIEEYYAQASEQYGNDPESTSIMILTLLELWVACDKAAMSSYAILDEYNPGIPQQLFQAFLLPLRSQMERLARLEKYLQTREKNAHLSTRHVFSSFGEPMSFSVRWFQQSPKHQILLTDIERIAGNLKKSKLDEFTLKTARYNELMNLHAQHNCTFVQFWSETQKRHIEEHSPKCRRCKYLDDAKNLQIDIYEWPLPRRSLESQSTVFELRVPEAFGHWRAATLVLRSQILGMKYTSPRVPKAQTKLKDYKPLSKYFNSFGRRHDTIVLLSEDKPYEFSKRTTKAVGTSTEKDVVVRNALHYRYYDTESDSFIGDMETSDKIEKACTYTLPEQSAALQKFLSRPAERPSGLSPNTVIATQSDCPEHMSIEVYKALCTLPLGTRIQWQNILVQLHTPSVDFKQLEATLFVLQCIFQAGPSGDLPVAREGHRPVIDRGFGNDLLDGLRNTLERIRENRQASHALFTCISLACRLSTLNTDPNLRQSCLGFLSNTRDIAMVWLWSLKAKILAAVDEEEQISLKSKVFHVALVSASTFDVDEEILPDVLGDPESVSLFLACSVIIQQNDLPQHNQLLGTLYRRWQRLSYRSRRTIVGNIYNGDGSLDGALRLSWPAYQGSGQWSSVDKEYSHWLVSKVTADTVSDDQLTVHFNVLDGELLANGLPLGRLPVEFGRDPVFRRLFGTTALDVMPSTIPGFRFSARNAFSGYTIHLGLSADSELLVRAVGQNNSYELVPSSVFRKYLPVAFVEGPVHWYNMNDDSVEFRSYGSLWEPAPSGWVQVRSNPSGPWKLSNGTHSFVSAQSNTSIRLSKLLGCLEDTPYIHCVLDQETSSLDIALPRLQLGFNLSPGSNHILSRQFRGMYIDENQSIGSLVGLESKLTLRTASEGDQRIVIVPQGSVQYRKDNQHMRVSVDKGSAAKVYAYRLDKQLGRLIDNGSLTCKLWLCYMHALTAFCLPDPLTQRTGTEQALSILGSAAVKSFDTLTEENMEILDMIAQLSPRRQHRGHHQQFIQDVSWQKDLGILAQHGRFHTLVWKLFDRHARSKLFYPDSYVKLPENLSVDVDKGLSHRDAIRSSTFRVADFGAEDFNTRHDVVYSPRDQWQPSSSNVLVTSIAEIIHQSAQYPRHKLPKDLDQSLWDSLLKGGDVISDSMPLPVADLTYDAKWLENSIKFVTNNWIKLHRHFTKEPGSSKRASITMWLSIIAYANGISLPVLYVLAFIYSSPAAFSNISIPAEHTYFLDDGVKPVESKVRNAVSDRAMLPTDKGKNKKNADKRGKKLALDHLVHTLTLQWDREPLGANRLKANAFRWNKFYDTEEAISSVSAMFLSCRANGQFAEYLRQIAEKVPRETKPLELPSPSLAIYKQSSRRSGGMLIEDVFHGPAPTIQKTVLPDFNKYLDPSNGVSDGSRRLEELVSRLRARAASAYETNYIDGLSRSISSLQGYGSVSLAQGDGKWMDASLLMNKIHCEGLVHEMYEAMLGAMGVLDLGSKTGTIHWPRVSPIFFLQNLARSRWLKLSRDWQECIIQYGLALTMLQQAERLVACLGNDAAMAKELKNRGHANWDAHDHPESLLLEIESGITIREVQEEIAKEMRTSSTDGDNQIMQLNMGEGKSSVVVPMVAAALADGTRLVRVIVAKPQAKQMFEMMRSKLGGLLDRPIYHAPFSRNVTLGRDDVAGIQTMYEECMATGGVLLVQPEHILSFQLMAIDRTISGGKVARAMTKSLEYLKSNTRDIVDESDENFSVRFELMYTMGTQRPIDHSPARWICIQEVLDIIRDVVPGVKRDLPDSVELLVGCPGGFPRTRILREDAMALIQQRVATRICEKGLIGFPIARLSETARLAISRYITQSELTTAEIHEVEATAFWSGPAKQTMLLLRGLIAQDVLGFVLSRKRWRVDFGLDSTRRPPTKLAVPYRAKDNPTARSEFGHPDVVILLTSLSYYYSGLSDDDLFLAFHHIIRSDQADIEYQAWVKDADRLPLAFQQLGGVNLEDAIQCTSGIFPHLRHGKAVVDYFLSHLVFPKEMREFPHKLSASGWDIGERKTHPTTGFSGTNDSRVTLPLSVKQLDLPDQVHTNAMVLDYLLRPENSIALMEERWNGTTTGTSDAERLLNMVVSLSPPVRVILDVGAQILELDNLGLARKWLEMMPNDGKTQAVVFFDDHDHLCVLDRQGQIEHLHTSPFATQLDLCLVFLDEVHTRGTDLRLPQDYRAAVTLGANLTKDRLVQACMRMRELGKGQSVVFCVPDEIAMRMRAHADKTDLDVSDILEWAISETWRDARRGMAVWASQGRRHQHHEKLWERARVSNAPMTKTDASEFLEEEAQSLEARYRPATEEIDNGSSQPLQSDDDPITQRCRNFGPLNHRPSALNEEQERELAPEIQQERQVQKKLVAVPLQHHVHPDLRHFISTGTLPEDSQCCMPALRTLAETSAAAHLDLEIYNSSLLATVDFARPIRGGSSTMFVSDSFQRSVQWILTSGSDEEVDHMIIVSPFEAQELLPDIAKSERVSLHLYAPRLNLGYRRLDTLNLYTIPSRTPRRIPQSLIIELNLFAGQLYFSSWDEYLRVSEFLRIGIYERAGKQGVDGDGQESQQVVSSRVEPEPLKFFSVLMTKIRRNCESIDKTHVGYVLDDRILGAEHFRLSDE